MSADPKCSTCAYRVNELRRQDSPYVAGSTMVCLHPKVVRQDCRVTRLSTDGACGHEATLWVRHSAVKPQTELFAAQAAQGGEHGN